MPDLLARPLPADDQFLTLEELRMRLRIGKTSAFELARQDRLPVPAIKCGRQYRFSRKALDEVLSRQHGGG